MSKILSLLFVFTFSTCFVQAQSISDLSWMTGYWTSSENGTTMEELWTMEGGGIMLGLHRDVFKSGKSSFEFMNISLIEDRITYLAQPKGGKGTPFYLIKLSSYNAVFENLEHDFPQRIIYVRVGSNLTARIEDKSGEKVVEWTWTKKNFND